MKFEKNFGSEVLKVVITSDGIFFVDEFDDVKHSITDYHEQDCCESVYAHYPIHSDLQSELCRGFVIETVADSGFRFGIKPYSYSPPVWEFVPCYNEQNGYYSNDLILKLDGKKILDITNCVLDKIY